MKIVLYPDPVLEKMASPIDSIEEYRDLLTEMKAYVENPENHSCGLALPQVGISKRAFVAEIGGKVEIFINPRILKVSNKGISLTNGEGCLSVPDVKGVVVRSKRIEIVYTTIEGDRKKEALKEVDSIVFQHEYDHLNGILFISKIKKEEPVAV